MHNGKKNTLDDYLQTTTQRVALPHFLCLMILDAAASPD
jgi:hypothetical protein